MTLLPQKYFSKNYKISVSGDLTDADDNSLIKTAKTISYPVVLKAHSEEIVHKSDIGAVILNIKNRKEFISARDTINKNVLNSGYSKPEEFLIQKMAARGFEVLVGGHQDPVFGPLIIVGSGG